MSTSSSDSSACPPPETELALSLYQDPLLIRALLEQLRLPEGAARVALSLGDGERGPFVVVARDGHFVTCLTSRRAGVRDHADDAADHLGPVAERTAFTSAPRSRAGA